MGYHFKDTVAIGDYIYADTHRLAKTVCTYPSYLDAMPVRPYYIPFRALTNANATNLLVSQLLPLPTHRTLSFCASHALP